jgi:probable rRNA maturation factor
MPAKLQPAGERQLGDIVISLPQVRRQAKAIGRGTKAEFCLMVVHGTLHLLGYDHETLADEKKMFQLQHDILISAGIL